MGITGLLPLLKSIQKPCNLKKFAGLTIGVDAYGWLHRGTVGCAIDLALEKPTTKFVDFAMSRVRMLLHHGVTPYIVFDGDYLPSKAVTEVDRAKRRAESRKAGLELHRMGRPSLAHLELQKAVDVTPEMARQLIDELKFHNVQYVVAPYEADAQLVYLERKGIIQGILSEDSDLLVFGAKMLLTKLDQYGDCIEINRNDFTACKEISLVGWSDAEFRRMAILSGCDYLPNINKMGLKTAYRLVRKHKSIERIIRTLQFEGQHHIPPDYLESFQRAELTFLHQRVFCPEQKKLVMSTDLAVKSHPKDFAFIGKDVEARIAIGVANGALHPMTKKPIVTTTRTPGHGNRAWPVQRSQSSSDAKAGKSIESFFKPKRIPLAELDPNSLTPSPSQQRLLEQYNGAFLSSPAPARPILLQSSASATTNSNPLRVGRILKDQTDRPSSVPHPTKRQRLCDGSVEDTDIIKCEPQSDLGKSRFFAPPAAEPSPTLRRARKKKEKATDVHIFSDNSIEDAMAGLPDFSDESLKLPTTTETAILETAESPVSTEEIKNEQPSQPQTSASTTTQQTESTLPSTAQSQVLSPVASQSLAAHIDLRVKDDLAALSARYAFKPAIETYLNIIQAVQTPPVSKLTPLQISASKPLLARPQMRTPLQRLQAGALRRTQSLDSASASQTAATKTRAPFLGLRKQDMNLFQTPPPHQTSALGSEDCLVPNSDDEEDSLVIADVKLLAKPKLDLGRFLCPR